MVVAWTLSGPLGSFVRPSVRPGSSMSPRRSDELCVASLPSLRFQCRRPVRLRRHPFPGMGGIRPDTPFSTEGQTGSVHVEQHAAKDDHADDKRLPIAVHADDIHAVGHLRDEQRADERTENSADAAEQAYAADHGRRDGIELLRA